MNRAYVLCALLGLAVLLAGAVAFELSNGAGTETASADATAAPDPVRDAAASPAAAAQPSDLAAQILARPLFSITRRPRSGPAAAPMANAEPASTDMPRLTGIVMTMETKLAIFQPKDAGKPIAVGEGQEIAGRKVATIDASEVVLLGPDGEETPSDARS